MVNKNKEKEEKKEFYSTSEAADLLGVSRVTVYNKVKSGEIPAQKPGRNYIIKKSDLSPALREEISPAEKQFINDTVSRVTSEYGETLRKLSKE